MKGFLQSVGVTDDGVAQAREALSRQMRREGEAFIDEAARRTMLLPGYTHLDIATVRPNTARSMAAILTTLEGGDFSSFGALLAEVAYKRARDGLPPRSLYELADITEVLLNELATRCLSEHPLLLAAAAVARQITDGARAVVIDAFQRAHFETRDELEHLASQFSAPLLPALPGVLVLPIVGPISANRAEQIVSAMLDGIERYAARWVILDLTGITEPDASLPGHVRRATASVKLLGAQLVLVGIKAEVALTLVADAPDFGDIDTYPTLAGALLAAASKR